MRQPPIALDLCLPGGGKCSTLLDEARRLLLSFLRAVGLLSSLSLLPITPPGQFRGSGPTSSGIVLAQSTMGFYSNC